MKNMTDLHAILIIAHGSRLGSSNREVARFSRLVAKSIQLKNEKGLVGQIPKPAVKLVADKEVENNFNRLVLFSFLELARPSIATALKLLVERGADKISIFPYFLALGTHVKKDIPAIVNDTMGKINEHRDAMGLAEIKCIMLPHLGKMENLATATSDHIISSLS